MEDFLVIFLLVLLTQMKSQFNYPVRIYYNQGLFIVDAEKVYLSEVSVEFHVIYEQNFNLSALVFDSVILEDYKSGDDKSTGLKTRSETENFTAEDYLKFDRDTKDIESNCKIGFLSVFAVPDDKLKEKLRQLEEEHLQIGYRLSIPIDSLENYYLTRGLVTECTKHTNSHQYQMIMKIEIPFVRNDVNYRFQKTLGLPFQNEYEDSICEATNKDVIEYMLVRNGSVIHIPTSRVNITPQYFRGFEKCQLGGEANNQNPGYNRVCHLGSDVLNAKQKIDNIPYVSCLKTIYEDSSRESMEKHCDLKQCTKRGELENVNYGMMSQNDHFLTNIKKTVKIRCSNKANDITMEKVPGDGALLFELTCGCKLLHGDVIIAETNRCKWYSKTIENVDFSQEKVKIYHLLPSKYIRDFQGYVLTIKDIFVRSNNMLLISGVIKLIEFGLYAYALRLAYLISLLIFLRKNPLRKLGGIDLIGVLYALLRFMPYWIPGWFFY